MAYVIRHGKTPLWGVFTNDNASTQSYILDSYNYSVEVKDYEQLDETGKVVGYLVYDQTVNFDMSGTLVFQVSNPSAYTSPQDSESLEAVKNNVTDVGEVLQGVAIHSWLGGHNCKLGEPYTAIVKSHSVNTSQGSAATFSLSGSIYDFTK